MKVVLIYRKPAAGAHSIEELFRSLAIELRKSVEIVEYSLRGVKYLLADLVVLRRLKADVYHVTGHANYLAALMPLGKTLLTVHDAGHYLETLKGLKKWIYGMIWFRLPLWRVRCITVISDRTRLDLMRAFGVSKQRLTVVENWYRPEFKPRQTSGNNARRVVLQIGCSPNKNVARLAEALSGQDCDLWIVGNVPADLQKNLTKFKIRFRELPDLSNEQLLQCYVNCDIVAFVSTFEGFGMPIIEAQAMGKPVLTSNISPMAEVAGNGACLVDPFDVAAIRDGLVRLLDDVAFRRKLSKKGLENVSRFDVAVAVAKYMDLYEQLQQKQFHARHQGQST